MTREELRERIKNEVVLHEGELADWQWRQKGLVDEATELGILPSDFIRLVNEVSLQVNRNYTKISELKSRIETLARQRARQLTPADIDQIAVEAERVQLSRSFVEEQWLPAILETIPETQPGAEPKPQAPAADPVRSGEIHQPGNTEPEPELKTDSVRRKIKSILDDYEKHIPAQSLRFLFKAVDYDETALAEEIRQYLSENYYASVSPPKGNTLKEKLISTDWRHLSWWEKGPAAAPTNATINRPTEEFAAGPSASSPASVRSEPVSAPAPATPETPTPSKSGLSDVALIALSVLTALVLIWVVMRLARGDEEEPVKKPPTRKERTEGAKSTAKKGKQNGVATLKSNKGSISSEERNSKKKKAGLQFDEVDDRIGEFGLRAARQGDRWGYINRQNRWMIKPIYDRVAPFNEKKASVELNGDSFYIDRSGKPVRSINQKLTNEF